MSASSAPDQDRIPAPILGWLVGALFFLYAWILRVSPSVMVEELMRDFAVGGAVLGQLSAWYFYGYAGMQIPVGLLLDRFGPRRLLTAAAAVCALGCVLFVTGGLATASLGRLLMGAGCAFSLVGAMAVAGQWFPARRFALLGGLAMMLGMAGGVFGQAPLRLAVESSSWRTTLLATALGALALSIAAWLLIRDRRTGTGGLGAVLSTLGPVARNRQVWLNALAGLGATGPLLGFAALWGVPYLEVAYGLPPTEAAAMASVVFVGWGAGAPFFGWLSDRIGLRRPPLVVAQCVLVVALLTMLYLPGLPAVAVGILCFVIGFCGSSQIINFALAREHTLPSTSATAIGFVNMLVTGTGALFQPAVGWLLDQQWDGHIVEGARVYDVTDYRLAFGILVAASMLGLICAWAVRESYCQQRSAV